MGLTELIYGEKIMVTVLKTFIEYQGHGNNYLELWNRWQIFLEKVSITRNNSYKYSTSSYGNN